ncbi:phage baseplate protein, partial [Falsochrobactrum shanghaiense]|uniref:phage baseplate protein n=1 Tax=Falsochrobactrum shanghaiense TaxID=2201899 RepID=UPI0011B1DEC4
MTTNAERASQAADVVAIYRSEDMAQVLAALRPLSTSVFETAQLMEHPVEDGSMIADHLVIDPTEVELPCIVQAADIPAVIDEARELHVGGVLLTVQTRGGGILNMVLVGIPREETPQAIDSPNVLLRLRQARFVEAEYGELKAAQVQ